jgi:hypothetical protein
MEGKQLWTFVVARIPEHYHLSLLKYNCIQRSNQRWIWKEQERFSETEYSVWHAKVMNMQVRQAWLDMGRLAGGPPKSQGQMRTDSSVPSGTATGDRSL